MKTLLVADRKSFETEINRLNRRAGKVGFGPINIRHLGTKDVTQRRIVAVSIDGETEERESLVPVTVHEFEIANLPDASEFKWELVATITAVEGDRHFVDAKVRHFDVTPYEKLNPCNCDHCHTARHRNLTYLVRNRETSQILQVGRNCFADYVGTAGLLKLEFVATVFAMFSDAENEGGEFIYGGGSSRMDVVELRKAIVFAEQLAIEQGGWVNNKYDAYTGERVGDGTHRIATRYLKQGGMLPVKDKSVLAEGAAIWKKADEIIAAMRDIDDEDEFAQALRYVCEFDLIPTRKAGLAAYAGQFLRQRAERLEREAKRATMKHVGTVGKRETFSGLVCTRVNSFDSAFGTCYIHVFADIEGNELVWKTSQQVADVGENISLKATVKEHGDYKGTPQTYISRAKVI